ncbi:hypothetical protein BJX70DRAFT_45511 [Aspergillus crustosus]
MDNEPDTYPAPYGRACSNCSQSKCKCIYPKAGGRCRRCQRLDKECRQPASNKRQRQSTRKEAIRRAEGWEKKLENPAIPSPVPVPNRQIEEAPLNGEVLSAQWAAEWLDTIANKAKQTTETNPPTSTPITRPTPPKTIPDIPSLTPTSISFSSPAEPKGLEAEELLFLFHLQFLPYFPCVNISQGKSAHNLRRERPFTWLAIMAVTCKSAAQRRSLNDKIKEIVAQKMIHDETNTDIDILHGLLIYLGWSNQHVYNKANIHVFTQLAQAAVYELGLHNPDREPKMMALCVHAEEDEVAVPAGQTMEERRAALACFYITSIISTLVQRSVSLRWTPFMDECLKSLEEQEDCPYDAILVHQVRLQLITDSLDSTLYQGGLTATPNPIQAPPAFYLHSMHTQLRGIESRIRTDSPHYKILLLHRHYASLTIHESALTNAAVLSKTVNFQQVESLYGCLHASKSWFDIFLTIPPVEYIGFCFSIFAQLVHNLVMLYQLSTLNDPGWDTPTVKKTVDVLSILSTVIENMSRVAEVAHIDSEPDSDVFSRVAKIYRTVQVGWEVRLAPDLLSLGADLSIPVPDTVAMPTNFPLTSDHDWMSDMLNAITQSKQ